MGNLHLGKKRGIIESEKLLATQTIVWEIVTGQYSAQIPYSCDSSTITSAFLRSWYPTYFQVYVEIAAATAAQFARQEGGGTAPIYDNTFLNNT